MKTWKWVIIVIKCRQLQKSARLKPLDLASALTEFMMVQALATQLSVSVTLAKSSSCAKESISSSLQWSSFKEQSTKRRTFQSSRLNSNRSRELFKSSASKSNPGHRIAPLSILTVNLQRATCRLWRTGARAQEVELRGLLLLASEQPLVPWGQEPLKVSVQSQARGKIRIWLILKSRPSSLSSNKFIRDKLKLLKWLLKWRILNLSKLRNTKTFSRDSSKENQSLTKSSSSLLNAFVNSKPTLQRSVTTSSTSPKLLNLFPNIRARFKSS